MNVTDLNNLMLRFKRYTIGQIHLIATLFYICLKSNLNEKKQRVEIP